MAIELLVTRNDGKATCMDITDLQLMCLLDTLEVGAEGFGQTDDDTVEETEQAIWSVIKELKEFHTEPTWDSMKQWDARIAKIESAVTLLKSVGYAVARRPAVD